MKKKEDKEDKEDLGKLVYNIFEWHPDTKSKKRKIVSVVYVIVWPFWADSDSLPTLLEKEVEKKKTKKTKKTLGKFVYNFSI